MAGRSPEKLVRERSQSIVPGHRVIQAAELARVGHTPSHSPERHPAKIELVKEGEIVKAIDVTCSCGEKIRIWCSYGDGT